MHRICFVHDSRIRVQINITDQTTKPLRKGTMVRNGMCTESLQSFALRCEHDRLQRPQQRHNGASTTCKRTDSIGYATCVRVARAAYNNDIHAPNGYRTPHNRTSSARDRQGQAPKSQPIARLGLGDPRRFYTSVCVFIRNGYDQFIQFAKATAAALAADSRCFAGAMCRTYWGHIVAAVRTT